MKTFQIGMLVAASALLMGASPAQQTGLEGLWRDGGNTIHLRLAPCGEAACATVVWATPKARSDARRGSGRALIGSQLLTGLKSSGPGKWRGKVYVPDIDRHASATVVRLQPDQLRVSGCVLAGLICKSREWQRIG